jgi:hypothetical protein
MDGTSGAAIDIAFAAPHQLGRYWTNNGQRAALALNGSVANDPSRKSGMPPLNKKPRTMPGL